MKLNKMQNGSAYTKRLPEGCKYCKEGSKMVLLVTGKCSGKCWYCPLSEKKKGKEVLYANEKPAISDEEIIQEAKSIDAEGSGITGGDPLESEDTFHYIELLKNEFGEDHHIHLYTQSTDFGKIKRLQKIGLDEIRFHPLPHFWSEIENTTYFKTIKKTADLDMDVGLEIPSIPKMEEEIKHLIKIFENVVEFINVNELEFSSTNWEKMVERGYKQKGDVSSAVEGSEELAIELLNSNFEVPLHYCSSSFKDAVQLKNRIKRRAQNVAKDGDWITDEGTLVRGVIVTENPIKVKEKLIDKFDIPSNLIWYDSEKDRIEISLVILEEICDKLEYECYGIEEYPTSDRLEVERWPLNK